jgi:hypothetical protein
MVEGYAGNIVVAVYIPIQVGLGHVLQRILIIFLLEQVGFA